MDLRKKGVIFTVDALLALAIFVAAFVGVYRTFSPIEPEQIMAVNFYAEADNFLKTSGIVLSEATQLFLDGDEGGANARIESNLSEFQRNFNLYLIILNNTDIEENNSYVSNYKERADLKYESNDLEEFFILRKYIILSVEHKIEYEGATLEVSVNSSLAGKTIDAYCEIDICELLDPGFNVVDWKNNGQIEIPDDAVIGTYILYAENGSDWGYDTFQVIRYGLVVMEVEK